MRMFVHAENIRLATGLKPFNFQHEGKWRSHARAIDTKPTGRQSQVIWNFAFLVMGLCLKSRLLTAEFPGIHSWWAGLSRFVQYLPPYVHMMVWSQQSTHSYEELAKCLACFALTSTVGERTGDMIQGYLRLRKVAKFTANMKERNRRWLHSALLDGHGCRHEQQTTNGCLMQTLTHCSVGVDLYRSHIRRINVWS